MKWLLLTLLLTSCTSVYVSGDHNEIVVTKDYLTNKDKKDEPIK